MQRSLDLMQQRVNGVRCGPKPRLFQSGNDQIEVNLPGVTDVQ